MFGNLACLKGSSFLGTSGKRDWWVRCMSDKRVIVRCLENNRAATAIEYGLIATFIAIAAIGAMTTLGSQIVKPFNNVSNKL